MKPGDEVVCIDDSDYPMYLQKGKVYIVDGFYPAGPITFGRYNFILPEPHVSLVGLDITTVRKVINSPPEVPVAWRAIRFRPVKKTDISVFEKLLRPVKVTEDA